MFKAKFTKYKNKMSLIGGNPNDDFYTVAPKEKISYKIKNVCQNIKKFDVSKISMINFRDIDSRTKIAEKIIINNNLNFSIEKEISNGAYGAVFLYTTTDLTLYPNRKLGIAVKYGYTKKSLDDDIGILDYIKKRNICSSSYVNSFNGEYELPIQPSLNQNINEMAIEGDEQPKNRKYIIMEHMDGTIRDLSVSVSLKLVGNVYKKEKEYHFLSNFNKLIKVCKSIAIDLFCFSKYNLYYTDVKSTNILYRCNNSDNDENNDENIDIVLADIGSIANSNEIYDDKGRVDVEGVSSYPPYDRCITPRNLGIFKFPNNKDVVWSFCILILSLCGIEEKYRFENMANYIGNPELITQDLNADIDSIISKIIKNLNLNNNENNEIILEKINRFKNICKLMVILDPKDRISLHDVYQFFISFSFP
jgi:hypothetical protein